MKTSPFIAKMGFLLWIKERWDRPSRLSKGELLKSLRVVTTNIYGMAAAAVAVGVYCASRNAADIGSRCQ